MVGDAEDRKRWKRYHELQASAARLARDAERASSVREALALRDRADALAREAHRLTV